ncbi:MAG: TauD/TfdA dioxygenase family protein [Lautropia sp.]
MSATVTALQVRKLSEPLGAEVLGADLKRDDRGQFETIYQAWLDADGLVVIRDQEIGPEDHIRFSRNFGTLLGRRNSVPEFALRPGYPELLVLTNEKKANGEPVGLNDAGYYWHSDVTFEECPAKASLLYGMKIPPEGGDTLFCNMYLAYATLPADVQSKIATLQAAHSISGSPVGFEVGGKRAELTEAQKAGQKKQAVHPVVRTHPETGRKALYVNKGFTRRIEGLAQAESQELLDYLFEHSTNPDFIYRHKWRPNDLLAWDNRCLMHLATAYDQQYPRHMNRTTVAGDRPC